ncbi:MAG: nucleotidyltransferase domain-containing protein [Acetobacteraceae bacterium]
MRPVNLAAETVTTSRFRLSRRTGTHGGHNTDRRSRSQTFSQGAGHDVWPSSRSGVLFGSRARGDARPDSDYDVAVFLRDMADRFAEMDRLADPGTDICDETGEFVHAMPYRAVPTHAADARNPLGRHRHCRLRDRRRFRSIARARRRSDRSG